MLVNAKAKRSCFVYFSARFSIIIRYNCGIIMTIFQYYSYKCRLCINKLLGNNNRLLSSVLSVIVFFDRFMVIVHYAYYNSH